MICKDCEGTGVGFYPNAYCFTCNGTGEGSVRTVNSLTNWLQNMSNDIAIMKTNISLLENQLDKNKVLLAKAILKDTFSKESIESVFEEYGYDIEISDDGKDVIFSNGLTISSIMVKDIIE